MLFDIVKTSYKDYRFQYESLIVDKINDVYNRRLIKEDEIKAINDNMNVKSDFVEKPVTEDGYRWLAGLECSWKGANVAILFPWKRDLKKDYTQMDRSINVYSDRPISQKKLSKLVEFVAVYTALSVSEEKMPSDEGYSIN